MFLFNVNKIEKLSLKLCILYLLFDYYLFGWNASISAKETDQGRTRATRAPLKIPLFWKNIDTFFNYVNYSIIWTRTSIYYKY